jgi:hypothetical protein
VPRTSTGTRITTRVLCRSLSKSGLSINPICPDDPLAKRVIAYDVGRGSVNDY